MSEELNYNKVLKEVITGIEEKTYHKEHLEPHLSNIVKLIDKKSIPEWKRKALSVLNVCKPEYKWIAMDSCKCWCIYSTKPSISEGFWENIGKGLYQDIPPNLFFDLDDAPDWRESLVERSE